MYIVLSALGETIRTRRKHVWWKNKGDLTPLCSRKIEKLGKKRQLTQKQLAEL